MAGKESTRRVTAADVARSLGVSRATVGYVLSNTPRQTISEATRQRVVAEAARLGYRPHIAAQKLASGRSRIVLVVLPDWPIEFTFRKNLEEAATVLDEAGYSMVTYTRHPGGHARPLWELLDPDLVIGYAMGVGLDEFTPEEHDSLRSSGVPKVLPDPARRADDSRPADMDMVVAGARLQVEHLADLGHRRLAVAESADPRLAKLSAARSRGARLTAQRLGLDVVDIRTVDHRDGSADQAVHAWRDTGVTGIVAFNDETAAAIVGSALRIGLSVPGDLAVIGHDDMPLAAMFVPSISSIRTDTAGLGRYLAGLALHAIGGQSMPDLLELGATLVVRESTVARR